MQSFAADRTNDRSADLAGFRGSCSKVSFSKPFFDY